MSEPAETAGWKRQDPVAVLEVFRDPHRGYQIHVGNDVLGFRLYGPPLTGAEALVARKVLTRQDRDEIRRFLDAVDVAEAGEGTEVQA